MSRPSAAATSPVFVGALVFLACCGSVDDARAEDAASPQDQTIYGVVIEEMGPTSILRRVGLREGDQVLSWAKVSANHGDSEPAAGRFMSPFDWEWLKTEVAPRGSLQLFFDRGHGVKSIAVRPGDWDVRIRPDFTEDQLVLYAAGRKAIAEGRLRDGLAAWGRIPDSTDGVTAPMLSCWLHLESAVAMADAGRHRDAAREFEQALDQSNGLRAQVVVWDRRGRFYDGQSELSSAESSFKTAMRIRAENWGEGLGSAANRCSLARLGMQRGRFDESEEALGEALRVLEKLAPGSLNVAEVHHLLAVVARYKGRFREAEGYALKALEVQSKLAFWSRARAKSLCNLAEVKRRRGNLEEAEDHAARAMAIVDWIAPRSLEKAEVLHAQAMIARARGALDEAERLLLRAMELREWLAPQSLQLASSINNYGLVLDDMGELDRAEEQLLKALDIRKRIAPGSLYVAFSYNNLGLLARQRGELSVAAEYYLMALEIKETVAPDTVSTAYTLNNLGLVADGRGDLETAGRYYERGLAIKERRAPGSLTVANSLSNIGSVAVRRGDFARAEECFKRTLVIRQRLAKGSMAEASSLEHLGSLARDRGDLKVAERFYRRALEIRNANSPNGISRDIALRNLGEIAFAREDLAIARRYFEIALEVEERLAPEATRTARTLFSLAKVARAGGELDEAVDYSRRAIEVLEKQIGNLGGGHEVRAEFRALYERDYRRHIDLLVATERQEEAFHVLERSRARSLLEMLAERDLAFTADVSDEIDRARKRLAVQYARKRQQLTELDSRANPELISRLHHELDQLRRQRGEITELIRRSSPRLASLQYPEPLDLSTVVGNLDPRSAMLSYSVGEAQTYLFLVKPVDGLKVFAIDVGSEELRREVETFRSLIRETRSTSLRMGSVVAAGRHLYGHLLEPVAESLRYVNRLVILPDGPLHRLPFGALVRDDERFDGRGPRDWQYLVEWKPFHFVQSATLYAELRRARWRVGSEFLRPQGATLAAFADPKCSAGIRRAIGDFDRGQESDLAPLPASRNEVERIRDMYSGQAEIFLGEAATEEAVLAVGKGPRILHFATHSHLDDRMPLNSALVLSSSDDATDERDDGLLQAWEIIERVRIAADLVVLSACRSGLGRELGGEGLVGLTRAFQYAGAQSVVASLWEAADSKTEELMVRFHSHLKAGKAKDDALQSAQVELIQGSSRGSDRESAVRDASAPFYWAGFQLYGDWR